MFLLATYLSHLLLIAGYIESNPGPNQAGRPRKATSISDFPNLQPNAFQASRLPSDDRLSQILDLTIISTIEDVIAELQTANRALINTMENKFDRLISTIEPRMASFENKLSTLQADMVSLASLSTVNTAPRVAATLSTGISAQATRHPLPTAASQVLGTPSSVSDVFNELHQRDLKKSNIIITGLLIDPNKSDADCASQLFRDLGINTHLK